MAKEETGGTFQALLIVAQGYGKGSFNEAFAPSIKFQEGSGSSIFFWHDVWVGDRPVATQFPEVYRYTKDRQARVRDYMNRDSY